LAVATITTLRAALVSNPLIHFPRLEPWRLRRKTAARAPTKGREFAAWLGRDIVSCYRNTCLSPNFVALRTAAPEADVTDVAHAIIRVVDAPFEKRPFRVHIDPAADGAEVVNAVADWSVLSFSATWDLLICSIQLRAAHNYWSKGDNGRLGYEDLPP